MDTATKKQIGSRLREKREQAGYSREKLAELCSLSPRFIANIEFGDATFSLDSLLTMCRALSCTSDELLFGTARQPGVWADTTNMIQNLDETYHSAVHKAVQGLVEALLAAERNGSSSL